MRIPTIKIKSVNPLGYTIINRSDFLPGVHTEYRPEEEGKPAPAGPTLPKADLPSKKKGKKR